MKSWFGHGMVPWLVGIYAGLLGSGCLAPATRRSLETLQLQVAREAESARAATGHPVSPPAPMPIEDGLPAEVASALAEGVRREMLHRLAQLRNPDLMGLQARLKAAVAQVPAAARPPDLEFKIELWAVPLLRPWALNQADTIMFGFRQHLPAPGRLQAEARGALAEAAMRLETLRMRRNDLYREVERAYWEYYRADRELTIHREHVELTAQLVQTARSYYRVGRATLQEVLRVSVALSELHRNLAQVEQERVSARALLNVLMNRPVDAPLGRPVEEPQAAMASAGAGGREEADRAWFARAEERRPELAAAARAVERSQAMLEAQQKTARWPSFTVGADYWLLPTLAQPHAYGGVFFFNLPWLNPQHRELVRAAKHTLVSEERALEMQRNATRFEVRDALARRSAAEASLTIVERDLLLQARQSLEAARAGYVAGQTPLLTVLDALHTDLEVCLEANRARAMLAQSQADLERAAGLGAAAARKE